MTVSIGGGTNKLIAKLAVDRAKPSAHGIGIHIVDAGAEEAFLRERFPQFEDYARKVPRLLPRLKGIHGNGAFSWDLYWKHREYNPALGSIAIAAVLLIKLMMQD